MNPSQEACAAQENEIFYFPVLADVIKGVMYIDQMGRFSVMLYEGVQYLFVA